MQLNANNFTDLSVGNDSDNFAVLFDLFKSTFDVLLAFIRLPLGSILSERLLLGTIPL